MINQLHRFLHRVEDGYDPVPAEHVKELSAQAWSADNTALLDELEAYVGGLLGKRVLDLGGGPGHFSAAFARRGAEVTWHDISKRYLRMLQEHTSGTGLKIHVSLGYLEDAQKFLGEPFDVVIVKQAWYYCVDDRQFARLVYELIKPGGACYITCSTPAFETKKRVLRRLVYAVNNVFSYKIGHPYPPHGRVAALLLAKPVEHMVLDYSSSLADRILFRKK